MLEVEKELDQLKSEVRRLFQLMDEQGCIEETGQTYRKITIKGIFDNDTKSFYNCIDKLKTMSE